MTTLREFVQSGPFAAPVADALAKLEAQTIVPRIWAHDHSVWRPDPTEIANRLGWLRIADAMSEQIEALEAFVESVREDGYSHAVLLGMGGSSLAPEVFYKTFGRPAGHGNPYLELLVLDSTDPDMVADYRRRIDPATTLFIVATKSGGTVETLSGFKYFYNETLAVVGPERVGDHFVAITDPGSKLVDLADRYRFRKTFLNDPNIGGRYSVLSYFGLAPAALVGVNLRLLLSRAQAEATNAARTELAGDASEENRSALLGAILGAMTRAGRDKVTFFTSYGIASFGDWVEQLIAESTGKEGKGILPVVGEAVDLPEMYGEDRLFVCLRLAGDDIYDDELAELAAAGHPVVWLELADLYDVGRQFFLWEMATVIAGHLIGIQPFDQPNVESAKILAREMVDQYMASGALPPGESALPNADALSSFLAQARPGDYVAFQAYVEPTPSTDIALDGLRILVRNRFQVATTVGYGPRFLHSTGQLHKGDAGNGLFVQFTANAAADLPIPDEAGSPESSMSFGVLKDAQALGDAQALRDAQRRLLRIDLGDDVVAALTQLVDEMV